MKTYKRFLGKLTVTLAKGWVLDLQPPAGVWSLPSVADVWAQGDSVLVAFAVLQDLCNHNDALAGLLAVDFRREVLQPLGPGDWTLTDEAIVAWMVRKLQASPDLFRVAGE